MLVLNEFAPSGEQMQWVQEELSSTSQSPTGQSPNAQQIYIVARGDRFHCSLCERSYTDKGNCATHIRSHYGETTCHLCNKSFARMENLRRHLQKHQGNIQCPTCQRTFGSKYSLKYHLKNSGKVCKSASTLSQYDL